MFSDYFVWEFLRFWDYFVSEFLRFWDYFVRKYFVSGTILSGSILCLCDYFFFPPETLGNKSSLGFITIANATWTKLSLLKVFYASSNFKKWTQKCIIELTTSETRNLGSTELFCFIHLVEPGLLGPEKIRWWENNGSDLIGVKVDILENFDVHQQKCTF